MDNEFHYKENLHLSFSQNVNEVNSSFCNKKILGGRWSIDGLVFDSMDFLNF